VERLSGSASTKKEGGNFPPKTGEHYKMAHGMINAAVASVVPECTKSVNAARYFMAVRCDTYEEAYKKWLLPIAHLLPIPLVPPWKQTEGHKEKFLSTTSWYSKSQSCPVCALEFVAHPTCMCG